MNKIDLTKTIVSTVVGAGSSKIVHTIIRNNVDPQTAVDSVTVAAGSLVLGSMVADATKKYTDDKIDALVSWWKTNITEKPSK